VSYGQCSNSFRYDLKGNNQEFAFDILELPGGDKVIGGQTKSFGAGGWDFYLTRMTKSGFIVWNKTYGGPGDEVMRRLRLSDDGNILITGSTTSYGNPNGEIIGMVIDPNGTQLLSVKLGESSGYSLGSDILHTSDNGYIVCGTNYSPIAASDWIIAKLDATGNVQWTRKFDNSVNEDAFNVIGKQDTIVVWGNSQNPITYAGISVKMSLTTGALYSSNAYNIDGRDFFAPKLRLSPGEYRIGMHIIDGSSYAAMQLGFIIMDTLYNVSTSFKIVNTPYTNFYNNGFFTTMDSGYIVTGSTSGTNEGFLYKFDKNNNLLFTRRFSSSGSFFISSAMEGSDSSIWLVGNENNHTLVIKLSSTGDFDYCPNQPITSATQSTTLSSSPFTWPGQSTYTLLPPAISPASTAFTFTIDSLCVSPICTQIQLTGKDTVCSLTDSIDYNLSTPGGCVGIISWLLPSQANARMVNDSLARIRFASGGTYKIMAAKTIGCSILKDSVTVLVAPSPDTIALGNDSTLCNSPSRLLDAGAGFRNYVWQDNSQNQTFTATSSGQYYVFASNYCHQTYHDSIKLAFRSPDSFGVAPTDTSYCIAGPFKLFAKGGDTYAWTPTGGLSDPQSNNPIVNPTASILYNVRISDTVCNWQMDLGVNIFIDPPPSIQIIKSNDIDCITGTAQLTASGGQTYQWSPASSLSNPNINNPVASPIEPTMYYVQAFNSLGCPSKDSILVDFSKTGDPAIYFPSAFSPNGDGHNDIFKIDTKSSLKIYEFSVYNRWGGRVFTTTDQHQGWDGFFNGTAQPSGIYVYFVRAWSPCAGEIFKKGTLMLIR